jgi:hypothetical protein
MLTYDQFITMTEYEQANLVWDGALLDSRSDGEYIIQLYGVSTFFVEVIYDPINNKIEKLRPFKTNELLEPYLKNIRL